MLEKMVPVGELSGLILDRVVKGLDAQHGADPREERRMVDRLREVVVAAGIEPLDDVARIGFRGHEERPECACARVRLEAADDLDAVDPRHHDVEEHEVGRGLPDAGQRLLAVAGDDDLVALRREPPRKSRGSEACRRRRG